MLEPKIIFKNKDFIILDKPSGLSVHSDGKTKEDTLADWLIKKFPPLKKVGEKVFFGEQEIIRPGIVHRLDKETSGVMVVARTQKFYAFLKKQFQNKRVNKIYSALVYGHPKKDEWMVDRPIGRSKNDFRKRVTNHARGEMRNAITYFRVVKKFKDYSLIEARPRTGRTHQIRVHLNMQGNPVVCDRLYSPKKLCPKDFGRLFLHAHILEFYDFDSKSLRFESPLPDKLKKSLDNLLPL